MEARGYVLGPTAEKGTDVIRRQFTAAILSLLIATPILASCTAPPPRCPYYEVNGTCFTPFEYVTWIDFSRHLQQYDERIACIRHGESDRGAWPYDDGYRLATGNGYYGAYQYLPSTWNSVARSAGRPDLVGRLPSSVDWWDQDYVTLWAVTHGLAGHWHGTRYCSY